MSTIIETELKEVLIEFKQQLNDIHKDISAMRIELTEVRTELETLKPSIQKIPDLAEKVGELKNWKQIGLIIATAMISSIFSGTIGGVIGWLIRGGKP